MGSCALIDPNWELTEEFGVMVGHTLVDATSPSANVFMINMSEEEVVLPIGSLIGTLVPVLSVSVARSMECVPGTGTAELPDYLEDIFRDPTLPWVIPVVSYCEIYCISMNMCFRRRENR